MRCSDIFPATATMERCRTDGSRSPDCASFPAHHSWGLVFARQSGARSRQVLENGSDSVVEETTRQVLPTAAAREAIAALPKHHVEPGPLLRRAGISEHVLRSPKATQNTEFILGCFRTAFRALTGRNATPTTVAFSHNRNSDLREFERFFGCGVEFGANTNLLALTDDALRIPLLKADPKLLHSGHCLSSPYGSRQRVAHCYFLHPPSSRLAGC